LGQRFQLFDCLHFQPILGETLATDGMAEVIEQFLSKVADANASMASLNNLIR